MERELRTAGGEACHRALSFICFQEELTHGGPTDFQAARFLKKKMQGPPYLIRGCPGVGSKGGSQGGQGQLIEGSTENWNFFVVACAARIFRDWCQYVVSRNSTKLIHKHDNKS